MPKAARISTSIPVPVSSVSREKDFDTSQLVSVAIFSGIGLLISLVAVICGVQGVWL